MVERIAFTQAGLERGARRLDDLVGRAEERARLQAITVALEHLQLQIRVMCA